MDFAVFSLKLSMPLAARYYDYRTIVTLGHVGRAGRGQKTPTGAVSSAVESFGEPGVDQETRVHDTARGGET